MTKESLCKTCKHLTKSIFEDNYYTCFQGSCVRGGYGIPQTTVCIHYEEGVTDD